MANRQHINIQHKCGHYAWHSFELSLLVVTVDRHVAYYAKRFCPSCDETR